MGGGIMYNEERKQEYIRIAKQKNAQLDMILTARFNETAPIEERLGKDLCEWTVPEILNYYKSVVSRSLETLIVMHSHFNQYAKWCLSNLFMEDSQNHFDEIDREILNAECVNRGYLDNCIVTRETLLHLLNTKPIVNTYEKFLVLGIFEGIGGKGFSDFLNLTMDDFDGNTVKLPNRTITVSPELVALAKKSSETYEYRQSPLVRWQREFDANDNRIIKAIEGSNLNPSETTFRHRIKVRLLKMISDYNEPAFNNTMLFESGRLEMIRKFMEQDGTDAITAIKQHDDEISNRYGRIYARERYVDKWSQFLELTD